ncbi:MAG TPA: hypothetical protein VFC24_17520 [Casimicrobiaceae bacterium]|nr:hypothetical protein [Casimicrobiaceae bacterium]
MRVLAMLALLVALEGCATRWDTVVAKHGWDGRDVADLVAAVGPEDSVIINKESKAFNWFRFGNCRLTAFTTLDNRIISVETEGSTEGCEVYIKKMAHG